MLDAIQQKAQKLINEPLDKLAPICDRALDEVNRMYCKSVRMQCLNNAEKRIIELVEIRLNKIAEYYNYGAIGYSQLHSKMRAIINQHVTVRKHTQIDDFIQEFCVECLRYFRKEYQMPKYQPRSRIEVAEFLAYSERYAKRKIFNRKQLLVARFCSAFVYKRTREIIIDVERILENEDRETFDLYIHPSLADGVRSQLTNNKDAIADLSSRTGASTLVNTILQYFRDREQSECLQYFMLRLQDLDAREINQELQLSADQRDCLQQRFKYHLEAFLRGYGWQIYHQWLGAELESNLGLTTSQWESMISNLSPKQLQIVELKKKQIAETAIARSVGLTERQTAKQWGDVLGKAWAVRNR